MPAGLSFADLVQILWSIPGVAPAILVGSVVAVVLGLAAARIVGGSRMVACLTLVGEAVLLAVTLVPDLHRGFPGDAGPASGAWHELAQCAETVEGVANAFTTMDGIANIALFAGPGFLATVWLSRPWSTVLVLTAQSAVIEGLQAVVAGSACQLSDWVANACGTLLGVLAGVLMLNAITRVRSTRRRDAVAGRRAGLRPAARWWA